MYDKISYVENHQIPEMFPLIEFEKAFDIVASDFWNKVNYKMGTVIFSSACLKPVIYQYRFICKVRFDMGTSCPRILILFAAQRYRLSS